MSDDAKLNAAMLTLLSEKRRDSVRIWPMALTAVAVAGLLTVIWMLNATLDDGPSLIRSVEDYSQLIAYSAGDATVLGFVAGFATWLVFYFLSFRKGSHLKAMLVLGIVIASSVVTGTYFRVRALASPVAQIAVLSRSREYSLSDASRKFTSAKAALNFNVAEVDAVTLQSVDHTLERVRRMNALVQTFQTDFDAAAARDRSNINAALAVPQDAKAQMLQQTEHALAENDALFVLQIRYWRAVETYLTLLQQHKDQWISQGGHVVAHEPLYSQLPPALAASNAAAADVNRSEAAINAESPTPTYSAPPPQR